MKTRQNEPEFKGFLESDDQEPNARKQIGKVALWANASQNAKAPAYRGRVQTENGSYRIVLWKQQQKTKEVESGI